MIARVWHGRTASAKAAAYLEFLHKRAIPDYRGTPGNLAALVLHRANGDVTHFVTFTLWESSAGIEAFAGGDINQPRYYPEDRDFLLEFEPTVEHFEVGAVDGLFGR